MYDSSQECFQFLCNEITDSYKKQKYGELWEIFHNYKGS